MRKFTFLCLFFIGMFTVFAENCYSYLTFETKDGVKISVPASLLSLSVNGNVLMVGEHKFVISNLSKMYFSVVNESTTNIGAATEIELDEVVEIYNLNGVKVCEKYLTKGVYIVKMKDGANKIIVR
ncbi:MAG: hypothetical protein J6Q73_01150 [Bacteroidaceae bacterium]|nr:hypothetical protein [Bacteroidaceae bacterium]